ncbi:MAG: hypothetical protein SFZ23_00915 [Planctomycetota bacterium]|nr:hypothetical protein [Planctomycetota bacterium]
MSSVRGETCGGRSCGPWRLAKHPLGARAHRGYHALKVPGLRSPVLRSVLVALVLALIVCSPSQARAHPKDGAHADVRITIDAEAVRMNLDMNLVFVDGIIYAPREDTQAVDEQEEPALRDALMAYFSNGATLEPGVTKPFLEQPNRLTIDGVEVVPRLNFFEIGRPTPEMRALFPTTGMGGATRIQMGLDFPVKGMPKSVTLTWGSFPNDFLQFREPGTLPTPATVEAQIYAEGLATLASLTRTEPEYTWHATGITMEERFMPVPEPVKATVHTIPGISSGLALVWLGAMLRMIGIRGVRRSIRPIALSLPPALALVFVLRDVAPVQVSGLGGASAKLPSEQEAVAIFTPLHANIYRAFDYTREGEIYDALARSVDGVLLDSLYNDVFRSLVMQEEGGAVSRVQEVTPISTEVVSIGMLTPGEGSPVDRPTPSFRVLATWRVLGSVYHWGHSHSRLNEYTAEYLVAGGEKGWRIAGNRAIEQRRIESAPILSPAQEQELQQSGERRAIPPEARNGL